MIEVREVLRAWLAGKGLRPAAEQAGVDRKTARRYVEAAVAAGLDRSGGAEQLSDELIGQVCEAVRPARPSGRGAGWDELETHRERIAEWVGKDLTVVKIGELLGRQGVVVPHRTLHRFCLERTTYRGRARRDTVPVNDGEPGVECQIDFAKMGLIYDSTAERRRVAHALIFTAVVSRHMFVWMTFAQTLEAIIAGCEAAWTFFGGIFRVLIPDNTKAIVADADATNPRFTIGWLEYAQARGFATDPARVRHPQDKPRVEKAVQYVRGNYFAGEEFVDLADAQARAEIWCATKAGLRRHGTTQERPAEAFADREAPALLPPPETAYAVPIYTEVTVHRDYHVQLGKALYSAPKAYIGCRVSGRADAELVKLFYRGKLIKTHPRQRPGGRSTDPEDLPAEKTGYALRDLQRLTRDAAGHGANVGIYAERILDHDLPWTRMRQVYRLLGLAKRYGSQACDTACGRALELDVIAVGKIASMLAKATENTPAAPARAAEAAGPARFARDPGEYRPARPEIFTIIDGAQATERGGNRA